MEHRTAPDKRLIARVQESHGHQLDPMLIKRLDPFTDRVRRLVDAHHTRHIGPVDVGVHQSYAVSHLLQSNGEVNRDGGLAHATLAGSDRNQMPYAGDRQFWLFTRSLWTHSFDLSRAATNAADKGFDDLRGRVPGIIRETAINFF